MKVEKSVRGTVNDGRAAYQCAIFGFDRVRSAADRYRFPMICIDLVTSRPGSAEAWRVDRRA